MTAISGRMGVMSGTCAMRVIAAAAADIGRHVQVQTRAVVGGSRVVPEIAWGERSVGERRLPNELPNNLLTESDRFNGRAAGS